MSTLDQILRAAGFTGAGLAIAEGVATAESGANAKAHNGNAATGDNSYGLFQINMLGSMGPARRAQYGLASNEALFDPLTNAKVAYKMSGGGKNWGPWSTFGSGAYRAFLGKDKTITNAPAGSPPASTAPPSTQNAGWTTVPVPGLGGIPWPTDPKGNLVAPSWPSLSNPLSPSGEIGSTLAHSLTVVAAVVAGAGLVLLGLNKAAGNPAGKAVKAAAPIAGDVAKLAML